MSSISRRSAPVAVVLRASAAVAAVEKVVASGLIAGVAGLILLNVFTRYFDHALYWVDEAAIVAMVWATLVAASLLVRQRRLIAVTIAFEALPSGLRQKALVLIDAIVLAFALLLVWMCWIWFAPAAFAQAGFDVGQFVMDTGNFIYGEPTNTLGIPKFWVWLIMPVFALTLTVHALANLIDSISAPLPAASPLPEDPL